MFDDRARYLATIFEDGSIFLTDNDGTVVDDAIAAQILRTAADIHDQAALSKHVALLKQSPSASPEMPLVWAAPAEA